MMARWWQLKDVFFHPENWGFMIQFDFRIFLQMSWFNHQLDDYEQIEETSHQHVTSKLQN